MTTPAVDVPLKIGQWLYRGEPPKRCPQCLGGLTEYNNGSYLCRICDYRWLPLVLRSASQSSKDWSSEKVMTKLAIVFLLILLGGCPPPCDDWSYHCIHSPSEFPAFVGEIYPSTIIP